VNIVFHDNRIILNFTDIACGFIDFMSKGMNILLCHRNCFVRDPSHMSFGNFSMFRYPPRAVYSILLVRESPKVTFQTYRFRHEITFACHCRILPSNRRCLARYKFRHYQILSLAWLQIDPQTAITNLYYIPTSKDRKRVVYVSYESF
jgi:hypothetical protein